MNKNFIIAIDGPAGSGKSSAARALAEKLGIYYLNTGATFRALALTGKIDFQIIFDKAKNYQIFFQDKNITDKLFTSCLAIKASYLAKKKWVRISLQNKWKEAVENKKAVIEGRDIAQVFPQAVLKIFMTADLTIRAERIGKKPEEIEKRDNWDKSRKINPLKLDKNYWVLDTSRMTIKKEVEEIIKKFNHG